MLEKKKRLHAYTYISQTMDPVILGGMGDYENRTVNYAYGANFLAHG